ncbi:MAG: hypothetical protein EOP45_11360 [Sphingobacteriaceae bacterium]|nr:MAG: hypothetical protein EOP45_11360 [Sphingobacteriaceae bacterium]
MDKLIGISSACCVCMEPVTQRNMFLMNFRCQVCRAILCFQCYYQGIEANENTPDYVVNCPICRTPNDIATEAYYKLKEERRNPQIQSRMDPITLKKTQERFEQEFAKMDMLQ